MNQHYDEHGNVHDGFYDDCAWCNPPEDAVPLVGLNLWLCVCGKTMCAAPGVFLDCCEVTMTDEAERLYERSLPSARKLTPQDFVVTDTDEDSESGTLEDMPVGPEYEHPQDPGPDYDEDQDYERRNDK